MADFVWGANGARMTPEDIVAQRKVADALATQAGDGSPLPVGTRGAGEWTQGLNRIAKGISAGMDYREADAASKSNADDNKTMIAALLGGGGGQAAPAVAQAAPTVTVPALASAPAAPDTTGKIYSNDEPSPLDPPSGTDRTRMIATILGEAGNEPQLGKNAVASVIRTRAVDGGYGGDTPSAVVTAPNQFEPWNTQAGRDRMAAAAADPRQAAAADAAIASAYGEGGKAPEDPTEGMTHFYSPAGQATLGRAPPSWAGGESVTIGGHVFNSPDDAPAARPVQVAGAIPPGVAKVAAAVDPGALPDAATPVQGALPTAQAVAAPAAAPSAAGPVAVPSSGVTKISSALNPAVLQAMTSPYASDGTKKIAALIAAQQMAAAGKPTYTPQTDVDGNKYDLASDGSRKMFSAADKSTPEQKNYEYGLTHPDFIARSEKVLGQGGELYHTGPDGRPVVDHKNDKTINADDVSQSTIDYLADRTRMGDPSVKIGYARNPGMIAKIDATAQQREEAGVPVSDAARNVTDNKVTLSARGSAERKLGTINTNNEFYGNNALGALDIAEKASLDVPRTDYPGVNKALNAYRTQTGDPKTVALGAALNTVVNDYAKFTGGGVGTDSLRGHAEEILNGAHSQEQLTAIAHMMRLEIQRGQQSPSMVRGGFDNLYAPRGSGGPAATPATVVAPPTIAPAAPALAPAVDPAALAEAKRRGLIQ